MDLKFLRTLIDQYLQALPPSDDKPDRPLGVVIHVKSEEQTRRLAKALERRGFTDVRMDLKRSFFRKRWEIMACSAPVHYAAVDLGKWLDSMYRFAQDHGGILEHWVPLALSNEEL